MPRQAGTKTYNTFVGGLVTEATPLTFPENASLSAENCDFEKEGNIHRRLGANYESGYSLSSKAVAEASFQTKAVCSYVWTTVAGDGLRNFLVIQVDTTLYYVDMDNTALSDGLKGFTTNLNSFVAPAASTEGDEPISVASGKGFLFVASKKLKPFYVTYSPSGDSITNTEVAIRIRDFDGVDDTLAIDAEPTSLSTLHSYNLKNQGWVSPGGAIADPVATYYSATGQYPGNNKQWWVTKDTSGNLDSDLLERYYTGNTQAPRGHYILDPFAKDRDAASGLSGIADENTATRPAAVAFFAGRGFWGGPPEDKQSGHIYFSQIIEDEAKIGLCYQDADPTSENVSDLIDTDGGVIIIPDSGNIKAMVTTGSSLLVFADNGLWSIQGSAGQGFTPTDYAVTKVSDIGLVGARTLTLVDGTPVWWSKKGIYTIGRNDVTDRLEARSLTEQTIQTFYDEDIEANSKRHAQGSYDPETGKVFWFYNKNGNNTNYRYKYERALVFDTRISGFYPYKISELDVDSPYIAGCIPLPEAVKTLESEVVTEASTGLTVLDDDNEIVEADEESTTDQIQTKFLTIVPGIGVSEWTYSLFNDHDFVDWEQKDGTGANFDSFFETGYLLEGDVINDKQATYITCFLRKTETDYRNDGTGTYILHRPSSCYMQAKWEWADNSNSSRWGRRQQVYRILKTYNNTPTTLDFDNGFPVVVTRNKVRGQGRSLHLRYDSEDGKDFDLYGWATNYSIETAP